MVQIINIKLIKLRRAEGPTDQCGTWHEFSNFIDVNCRLRNWSYSVPKGRAYDKCDFILVWQNGESFNGCYDLKHFTEEIADLGEHVRRYLQYVAGERCPAHYKSDEHYQAALSRYPADLRVMAKALLTGYQLTW